jgi:anti-sigma factor RsiW
MRFSDEVLMAYADGVLGAEMRQAVELAMQHDAALARRVAQYKTRRANAFAGFAPAEEPAPQRLRGVRQATVINLGEVRARREASQLAARKAAQPKRWTWQVWGALCGVLLLGVAAGKFGLDYLMQPDAGKAETLSSRDGSLTAQGRLAIALDQQLSSTQGGQLAAAALPASATAAASPVRIGASFVSNEGSYCRSFVSGGSVQDLAGLACKAGQDWRVLLVVQNPRMGGFRSLELPAPVLQAVEQHISGDLLDPRAEHEAMQRGWQR